jgi:hypothetical protein
MTSCIVVVLLYIVYPILRKYSPTFVLSLHFFSALLCRARFVLSVLQRRCGARCPHRSIPSASTVPPQQLDFSCCDLFSVCALSPAQLAFLVHFICIALHNFVVLCYLLQRDSVSDMMWLRPIHR